MAVEPQPNGNDFSAESRGAFSLTTDGTDKHGYGRDANSVGDKQRLTGAWQKIESGGKSKTASSLTDKFKRLFREEIQ
jgi:hypothetical protein